MWPVILGVRDDSYPNILQHMCGSIPKPRWWAPCLQHNARNCATQLGHTPDQLVPHVFIAQRKSTCLHIKCMHPCLCMVYVYTMWFIATSKYGIGMDSWPKLVVYLFNDARRYDPKRAFFSCRYRTKPYFLACRAVWLGIQNKWWFVLWSQLKNFGAKRSCFIDQVHCVLYTWGSFPLFLIMEEDQKNA